MCIQTSQNSDEIKGKIVSVLKYYGMTTISDEYNIIGCDRRVRLREQKINQLLND